MFTLCATLLTCAGCATALGTGGGAPAAAAAGTARAGTGGTPPPGGLPVGAAARARRVAPGVTLGGRPVGGLAVAAAAAVVADVARTVDAPALDAYVERATGALVPGVDGVRLDVDATLARALAAAAGSAVAPVLRPVPPPVSLADLPPAPLLHANRERQAVAFVINVAWGEQHLPALLAALRQARARATFCLVGRWAEHHPDQVRAIMAAAWAPGAFTFCNHGYRDTGWADLSAGQARAQIAAADRVIAGLTRSRPAYFSPHRGEWTPAVLEASRAEGHELVLWSLDTVDWRPGSTAAGVLARVVTAAAPGDIILMHPTAPTAAALPGMIAGVREKGLRLVTLDALLSPAPLPDAAR